MHDQAAFGLALLAVSGGVALALLGSKASARISLPSAVVFLVVTALVSDAVPSLGLSILTVDRIATVALVVILFEGGASMGWRRFRGAIVPIAALGTVGTFATAGALAAFAHWAFGLPWVTAGLLGAAIAPTDPAVMFSLLGDRDTPGRPATILEGESGTNDPVGIALVLGLLQLAANGDGSPWIVVRVFALQMGVGLAVGIAGGLAEAALIRRVSLPSPGLSTIRTLASAGVIYGAATVASGSGFLAVFIAGLIVGDVDAPFDSEREVFQKGVSALAEIVVFAALGLTIHITGIGPGRWGEGLLLAAFAALVARPLVARPLLARTGLDRGERLFVLWGGLKGAVPILLGAYVLQKGVDGAQEVYELVFVVVLASVIVQGGTLPLAARRLRSPRAGVSR